MIPLSVIVSGRGTVSFRIKGVHNPRKPSRFSEELRPVVFWNITYKCNLKCIHCYIDAGPTSSRPELAMDEVLRVASEIRSLGIPLVVFTGGEPLVSPKFWKIAEYLSGGTRLALSSNGTLITRSVAARLKRLGFSYVGVSLDSVNPENHDKFRGARGAFKAAVRGIKALQEEGISTGLRITVYKGNLGEIPGFLELAYNLGIERVAVYLLDTVGRARAIKHLLPSPEEVKELVDTLIEEARKYSGLMEIVLVRANFAGVYLAKKLARTPEEEKLILGMIKSQGDCGRRAISIYPDGSVKPCQFIDTVTIGNLRRQSLKEILSPTNEALKPFLEPYKYLRGPNCSTCPYKQYCGGGSRGRAEVFYGDFWGDDPLCFLAPLSTLTIS